MVTGCSRDHKEIEANRCMLVSMHRDIIIIDFYYIIIKLFIVLIVVERDAMKISHHPCLLLLLHPRHPLFRQLLQPIHQHPRLHQRDAGKFQA